MSIKRIVGYSESGKPKYKKYDFPEFMKYTREIKYTKDGKELPQEEIDESKNKLKSRINKALLCPMNWLEFWISKISRNRERDDEINKKLLFLGWTVIRFWGNDIKKKTDECIRVIEETIFDIKISDD